MSFHIISAPNGAVFDCLCTASATWLTGCGCGNFHQGSTAKGTVHVCSSLAHNPACVYAGDGWKLEVSLGMVEVCIRKHTWHEEEFVLGPAAAPALRCDGTPVPFGIFAASLGL